MPLGCPRRSLRSRLRAPLGAKNVRKKPVLASFGPVRRARLVIGPPPTAGGTESRPARAYAGISLRASRVGTCCECPGAGSVLASRVVAPPAAPPSAPQPHGVERVRRPTQAGGGPTVVQVVPMAAMVDPRHELELYRGLTTTSYWRMSTPPRRISTYSGRTATSTSPSNTVTAVGSGSRTADLPSGRGYSGHHSRLQRGRRRAGDPAPRPRGGPEGHDAESNRSRE